ncbi:asparagine synthase (glutamine-hydrolyzing) [Segniliparus rugosus]|uniref:asparagine synthase (glutamine-hydrolyzing) n=1 Tax=Segniliparus rugosus (strain ATCC BAA-974 / DSM 45345 / CCUG 50838 / CIP 108380 / JCM 13579 / CDC 945) TaxID=679197 RepID=E5XML9_SEGRC|nr:asparagine synthase (glutamine-hydrolyzing) [Segniliparus rugosus]EFV14364.1 asparagine synthase (glutamine-hydrolyzing) [Segniliparus rugosus ATCC BAA-974]
MCGLLGALTHRQTAAALASPLDEAAKLMRHRGPDDPGVWHDDDVAFAFNRLSIIDVDHSHQPLRWGPPESPERYALIFNGEIYNYRKLREELAAEHGATFATEGDGEAIVAAWHHWGAAALPKLRGMFAFAIWDTAERVVVLARDPFGIKPLYYAEWSEAVVFGSEKKSVVALAQAASGRPPAPQGRGPYASGGDEDIDRKALAHYLALQYVPEPETLHRSVRRLESGTHAILRPGEKPVFERHFRPDFGAPGLNDPAAQILAALEDSVAAHMVSDPGITVGSFLSGGIDSTAIAALAIRHNPNLMTFTTGFAREGYSEIDVAAESAQAIGAKHIVKVVAEDEFVAALPEIVWYLDDPVADPALVPLYFVAKEARKHVKVVLSGEGADELFGGYTIYREPLSLRPLTGLPAPVRHGLRRLSAKIPEGVRGKSLLWRGSMTLEERYYGNARNFADQELRALTPWRGSDWGHTDVTAPIYAKSEAWDPVARMQHLDLFTWLRGDILVKADKMTMANSLELRVPFLDPEVFAVAKQLRRQDKIHAGTTKFALRQALAEVVPAHVLDRPKLGFPVPIRVWLKSGLLADFVREQFETSRAGQLVDLGFAKSLLARHQAGEGDHSRKIWTVLLFVLWHAIFVEGRIVPSIPEPHYPVRI